MDAGSSRPPGIVDRLLTRRFPQSSCVVDPRCNTTSIVTPSILSLVKELVPGTNYRTKITLNQKDLLNEVSFYNLYQNELLHKTKLGEHHFELVRVREDARSSRIRTQPWGGHGLRVKGLGFTA